MNLALLSTKEDKIEVAKYFETRPSSKENSIELYYKAGELSKALDLCFQYRQYDILQQIAEELTVSSNPETIRKVAEYFVKQEQFEKAVQILLQSERASEALEMCLRHHVIITEELAEKLTPLKPANESPEELKLRMETLEYLGDGLVSQRSYHLAAMKFTQAGNKIKAMKALLKSGDTERITFFANVSRQKEIYVMAANYLQSLNWRGNTDIMKNIIGFYTKGRAFETLANFYDTCAKAEIEEYQDYDRAQGALNEALIVLNKIKDVTSTLEDKKKFITRRLELIQKFNNIRA
jgi:intraflagellar transport protein 140